MWCVCVCVCVCVIVIIMHEGIQMNKKDHVYISFPLLLYQITWIYYLIVLVVKSLTQVSVQFSSVQFSSVSKSCLTLWNPMNRSRPGLPVHHQLPYLTQTHVHRVSDAIQPSHFYHPLLLLPPIPSRIRFCSNESTLRMRWPNYWSFSFSISPSNEHPGLISFRMDWLDLLAVQGTLKSLLQHHSSKA